MKHSLTLFLFFLFQFSSFAQVNVDVVLYSNPENTEHQIKNMLPQIIDAFKAENSCSNLNIVSSLEEATSPYVLEVWESGEFLRSYVFKQSRKKKETKAGQTAEVKYTAAGVANRSHIDLYMRLLENDTYGIIDLKKIQARVTRELSDSDVKSKYKPKFIDNVELTDAKLIEHEAKILEFREATQDQITEQLKNAIYSIIGDNLMGPDQVTGIHDSKDDKAKSVKIDPCPENNTIVSSNGASRIYHKEEILGHNAYFFQGGTYISPKAKNVYNITKKKEVYQLISDKKEMLMGVTSKYFDNHNISSSKAKDAVNMIFEFKYADDSEEKEYDRLKAIDKICLEFHHQAKLLNNNDIRLLAYEGKVSGVQRISVSFLKPSNFEIKTENKMFGLNLGPSSEMTKGGTKSLSTSVVTTYRDKVITNQYNIIINQSGIGISLTPESFYLDNSYEFLDHKAVSFVKIHEEEKGKIKSIIVHGNSPVDAGVKYYASTNANMDKKSKNVVELKVKDQLNKFLGLAEVKKNDKLLRELIDSGSTFYIEKVGSGIFSGDSYSNFLKVRILESFQL